MVSLSSAASLVSLASLASLASLVSPNMRRSTAGPTARATSSRDAEAIGSAPTT